MGEGICQALYMISSASYQTYSLTSVWPAMSYLAKYGMLRVEVIASVESEKELTAIVIRASIRHGNQATAIELETLMEFILAAHTQQENRIADTFGLTTHLTRYIPSPYPPRKAHRHNWLRGLPVYEVQAMKVSFLLAEQVKQEREATLFLEAANTVAADEIRITSSDHVFAFFGVIQQVPNYSVSQ